MEGRKIRLQEEGEEYKCWKVMATFHLDEQQIRRMMKIQRNVSTTCSTNTHRRTETDTRTHTHTHRKRERQSDRDRDKHPISAAIFKFSGTPGLASCLLDSSDGGFGVKFCGSDAFPDPNQQEHLFCIHSVLCRPS